MNTPDSLSRLTLVFPPMLEERLVALLLDHEPPLPGFTVLPAEGHGADFGRASVRERVRGRVARRLLTVVLPTAQAGPLIESLRQQVHSGETAWWLEGVQQFGRLA